MELNKERSRCRKQKNGLPQGIVLAPTLLNIYTNDQPIHYGTRSFIYADDLCITAQYQSFKQVEKTIEEALDNQTTYYKVNSLRANPEKTQITAFYIRNKEANRSMKVVWNKTELENTTHPKYFGVTLDRSISYTQHIQNTKMKVATRNNLLTKLATSKRGANPSTIRKTALALSSSTVDYVAPVWARSAHAKNMDPELNQACRSVTGCLNPTNVEDLYLLSGITPPAIRRDVGARMERQKQTTRETHSLFVHISATRRPKSRHCFLSSVQLANFQAKVTRCIEWRKRLRNKSHIDIINLHVKLAKGYDSPWTTWRCLNRRRTGYHCSKAQRKKWKFYTGDTTCACGKAEETAAPMLQCSQLSHPCSLDGPYYVQ